MTQSFQARERTLRTRLSPFTSRIMRLISPLPPPKKKNCIRILLIEGGLLSRPTFRCLYFSKYSLKEIIDVEENHDVIQGDRYLIDVVSEYWEVYFRKPLYLVLCGLLVLTVRYPCFLKELKMEGKSKYRQSLVYNISLASSCLLYDTEKKDNKNVQKQKIINMDKAGMQ